jgi:putative membrane protein insertion efficiency factor
MGRAARLAVFLIGIYQQLISPALPRRCRFEPTCSTYAAEAVREHGALRGLGLALGRIARCHPFNAGGLDPVPRRPA